MIGLVLSMIGARRAQALALLLLSTVVTAAAVAGPVALHEVDRAIVGGEVAAATNAERALSVTSFINPSATEPSAQFDTIAALVTLPGFDPIRAGELEAFGPVTDGTVAFGAPTSRVAFRDRVCEHLSFVEGRCVAGPLEVVIGADTARTTRLHAGMVTVVQAARYVVGRGLIPDGAEIRLAVVGVYEPRDATEVYWAGQQYFPVGTDGNRHEALFTTVQTFDAIDHSLGQASIDAIAPPQALTVARMAGLRDEVARVTDPLAGDSGLVINTDLPGLADRVQRSRDAARQLVPVAFLPLVALCLFVIYLAAGYGAAGRRPELGLVALRGVGAARRMWLAIGETVLVIVAGAPIGYLLGYGVVALVARVRLGEADAPGPGADAIPYAGLALAGALLVALLGLRRATREPVAQLLRGVPPRRVAWRSLVVEALVAVLAGLGVAQLRSAVGLRGVALLVPGLVVVAVVLLAARAVTPAAGLLARQALWHGRLGLGLAAVQLARRPGSHRLFVLVAVAAALLSFVAAGIDVAARGREDRARIVTGATTVLSVDQGDVRRLLHATRAVDPDGSWAMAALPVDQSVPGAPRILAVDSSRLGAVATWRPEFGASAAAAAGALRPPPARPFMFTGRQLVLDVQTERLPGEQPADLTVTLAPLAGGDVITVEIAQLAAGRATRRVGVSGCAEGCRLTGLSARLLRGDALRMTLFGVAQDEPPGVVVPPADLIARGRWRTDGIARVAPVGSGLQVAANPSAFQAGQVDIAAVDAPLPVPVVAAKDLGERATIDSVDGRPVDARVAVSAAMLPRLGTAGALVDLEYLERTALFAPRRAQAEVWLGPGAPPDATQRLRRAGLAVSRSTGIDASRAELGRQGTALALQFHLAAATFGVALALGGLALVASVDRRRRAEDLRALRHQGLAPRALARAAVGGYLSIVVVAALAGLGAAVVAWLVAGDRLPVFTDSLDALRPPRWPSPGVVLGPWLAATAAMVLGSVLAALALRRTAAREGRG